LYANAAKSRVKIRATGDDQGTRRLDDLKKSLKIAKGLFASFMLFTLCWLPYGLVVMSDFGDHFPPAVHAYTMAIAHFNSSLNPVLYAVA
jgi:hypothetical protein